MWWFQVLLVSGYRWIRTDFRVGGRRLVTTPRGFRRGSYLTGKVGRERSLQPKRRENRLSNSGGRWEETWNHDVDHGVVKWLDQRHGGCTHAVPREKSGSWKRIRSLSSKQARVCRDLTPGSWFPSAFSHPWWIERREPSLLILRIRKVKESLGGRLDSAQRVTSSVGLLYQVQLKEGKTRRQRVTKDANERYLRWT